MRQDRDQYCLGAITRLVWQQAIRGGSNKVVNVRSQDGALGDLSFQVGPQAHRTSNIVADSAVQELRVAGRERLIVVEDDPVTRAMIAGYFTDNNFTENIKLTKS